MQVNIIIQVLHLSVGRCLTFLQLMIGLKVSTRNDTPQKCHNFIQSVIGYPHDDDADDDDDYPMKNAETFVQLIQ